MLKKCPQCSSELEKKAGFCPDCGHPVGRDVLLGGVVLQNRYSIIKVLTTQDFGNVYKAIDLHLGNALCIVSELLADYIEPRERQKAIIKFREEAYVLTGLRHQGLPVTRDYFDMSGKQYLVTEFIEGDTLQEILDRATKEKKMIVADLVIKWGMEICDILEYLHGQSPVFVFKEIRPQNILMRLPQEKIVLQDCEPDFMRFIPGKRHIPGIPGFVPREQYEGNAEPSADIYALGQTLLYLLTGVQPNPFKKIRLSAFRKDAREGLERVLEIAVAEMAASRFRSAEAMKESLGRLLIKEASIRELSSPVKAAQVEEKSSLCTEKALEYLRAHQIEEAILECNKALIINPSHSPAYLYLGHAYLKEGRKELALEKYRRAAELDPQSSKVRCNLALALYQIGNVEEAIKENQKALELDRQNVYARNNLGSIYRDTGRLADAIKEYEKALEVDSRYMAAHYNLGLTYYEKGNFSESAKESESALESDPKNVHARINLSLAYFKLGRIDSFIECNKLVLDLDPGNARAFNNLGVASYAQGDFETAIRAFRKSLDLDRSMESAQHNLGLAEEELKSRDK